MKIKSLLQNSSFLQQNQRNIIVKTISTIIYQNIKLTTERGIYPYRTRTFNRENSPCKKSNKMKIKRLKLDVNVMKPHLALCKWGYWWRFCAVSHVNCSPLGALNLLPVRSSPSYSSESFVCQPREQTCGAVMCIPQCNVVLDGVSAESEQNH